ncbi:Peroxidase 16 [Vitis vinifera]|uniref:peroxidase n=1 Tax=Vitis vinifera TaxID=29760 RepID=A0A438D4D3_VITVI|nr:Peroxidase 16 [Vitis vinifera]
MQAGGPSYKVELGRRDGRISTKASVQHKLPHPDFSLDQLNTMFSSHGLTQKDMIALSGAHTIGFSHCSRFFKRIYRFSNQNRIDPTLNATYALQLRQMCPTRGMGLFTSDQALFTDTRSRPTVNQFAASNAAFGRAFVSAITKLGRVGVKTGNQGEIRHDCTSVN